MRFTAPLAAGLAFVASTALADEQTIRFQVDGQSVVGTLSLPDGGPAPVVVMFHGFTGSRDELPVTNTEEGVFSRSARLLREQGIASLRIDFRDSGESDGAYEFTTFERQVEDGIAALATLAADPRVQGDRIGLIGWSQGGLVATAVAGRSDAVDAVALWAAVADPETTYAGLLGTDTLTAGLAVQDGGLQVTLPWGAVIGLRREFFEGVASFDPIAEIAAYSGPLFVAQGTRDETVNPASADALIGAHEGPEELWTADMDHVFNAFGGPETLDTMVAATATYLQAHL